MGDGVEVVLEIDALAEAVGTESVYRLVLTPWQRSATKNRPIDDQTLNGSGSGLANAAQRGTEDR